MDILGTNIISSLGFTTDENFENVKCGVSGIKHYDAGVFDLPKAFMASLIDKEKLNDLFFRHVAQSAQNYTDLEKSAILSVMDANEQANIDLSNPRTLFIISTTKGNVDLLDAQYAAVANCKSQIYLWHSAKLIADFFKNPNTPVIVSNACISGACVQIEAMRMLESEKYDYVAAVGVDFLSKFIISGFQSFQALSPERCKPFDKYRAGLNLGEAAATIILGKQNNSGIQLKFGAIRNDANHISAPSRTGEGNYRALSYILQNIDKDQIAFINAHGTATPYNDAMETQAISRAGLTDVPVNSLKAFFGHTLGAAGVLESIISIKALSENTVLKSLNFSEQDFEYPISISKENQPTDKKYCIKMLSGFGGCNAALIFEKCDMSHLSPIVNRKSPDLFIKKHIHLSFNNSVEITDFYRNLQIDYPKFFKMDNLSKLGFAASEKIFENEENRFAPCEDVAVICFNRSSSLDIDTQYQKTIQDNGNYFPSPSLFVYTLPNIVTGEIAIRNKFLGETSFYVSKEFNVRQMVEIVRNAFSDKSTNAVLAAWIECFDEKLEVFMWLIDKISEKSMYFAEKSVNYLYKNICV